MTPRTSPRSLLGLLALLTIPVPASDAALLATGGINSFHGFPHMFQGSDTSNLMARFTLSHYSAANPLGDPVNVLFDEFLLGPSDLGVVFSAFATNDPDFDPFAAWLTNGEDDTLYERVDLEGCCGRGGLAREGIGTSSQILTYLVPTTGPDLFGYSITHVEMEMTQFTRTTPGRDPNGDGMWTDYTVAAVFRVFGDPIPEPSAHVLCLLAFGAVAFRRHRTAS